MNDRDRYRRIAEQFSYRSDRADIWRGFDAVLETGAFLNLGYSRPYQPHVLGSSQLRLAGKIGRDVGELLGRTRGARLLDLGCGRGGPALHLARTHGFDVVGLDLVPYNVARAVRNAADAGADVAFVTGDASALPFSAGSFDATAAIDSIVYVDDKPAVFDGLATAVAPGGVVAASDLVVADGADRGAVDDFAAAWDFARLESLDDYTAAVEAGGLDPVDVQDISANSTARFGKWARLFLALADGPLGPAVGRLLGRWDVDRGTVVDQVRATHRALPYLRHVIVYARR